MSHRTDQLMSSCDMIRESIKDLDYDRGLSEQAHNRETGRSASLAITDLENALFRVREIVSTLEHADRPREN